MSTNLCHERGCYVVESAPTHLHTQKSLTLVLRRGGGWLKLPCDFLNNFSWQPKVTKLLFVIYTNPITHRFTNIHRNLGVSCRYGELSKALVEGEGWWNSMILILTITKIFDKIYACYLICRLEKALPCLFCQISHKELHVSTIFCQKSTFAYSLCKLSVIVNISKISRARFHYYVIQRRMVLFWYRWKEETHSYTLISNIRGV